MTKFQIEMAKATELQKQARDVRADLGEATNRADAARKVAVDLQAQVDAGTGHWSVRDELKAARDEQSEWEAKGANFRKRLEDLNTDAGRVASAEARARNLQTQYSLDESEFEELFALYFEGGTFEAAKRRAASLAAKAAGKPGASSVYQFNPPGSVRW